MTGSPRYLSLVCLWLIFLDDKAFSSTGAVNNPFMTCENLTKPRVSKQEIKNIILNNGQNLLSPERRFDAIICNSPDIFEE